MVTKESREWTLNTPPVTKECPVLPKASFTPESLGRVIPEKDIDTFNSAYDSMDKLLKSGDGAMIDAFFTDTNPEYLSIQNNWGTLKKSDQINIKLFVALFQSLVLKRMQAKKYELEGDFAIEQNKNGYLYVPGNGINKAPEGKERINTFLAGWGEEGDNTQTPSPETIVDKLYKKTLTGLSSALSKSYEKVLTPEQITLLKQESPEALEALNRIPPKYQKMVVNSKVWKDAVDNGKYFAILDRSVISFQEAFEALDKIPEKHQQTVVNSRVWKDAVDRDLHLASLYSQVERFQKVLTILDGAPGSQEKFSTETNRKFIDAFPSSIWSMMKYDPKEEKQNYSIPTLEEVMNMEDLRIALYVLEH